jgi:hypothetical protein
MQNSEVVLCIVYNSDRSEYFFMEQNRPNDYYLSLIIKRQNYRFFFSSIHLFDPFRAMENFPSGHIYNLCLYEYDLE